MLEFAANAGAAMWDLIRPDVFFEVFLRIQSRARFQHDHIQSALGQHFRGGPACGARANNAYVIDLR